MPLKILLISYNYAPELTGIGKYNTEFCSYLVEEGNQVDVITGVPYYPQWKIAKGYKNSFYTQENIQGVNLTRCPVYIPSKPSGLKRMLMDLSFYGSTLLVVLTKLFSLQRYDVVFVPSPSFLMGLHILLLRVFWRKTKFVYHIQDLQIDAALELGMIKQPWLKNVLLKTEQLILERSSMVSTISEGMRTKILAKSDQLQDVYIMPNWVDDQVIYSTDPNLFIISELGIPLDKKIFFYSGSIGEKQGLEVLLPIAKALEASCPDLLFVISGSGPYKEHLQAEVAKNEITTILFIDLQPTHIFNHLLNYVHCHLIIQKKQAADLLLPSKLTNILAVGGLSIITTEQHTSLFDIVQKNALSLVVEPENTFALQASITEVYSNLTSEHPTVMLQEIKHNAKVYAAKHLNKKGIIDAFMKSVEIFQLNKPQQHYQNFPSPASTSL